MAQDNLTTPMMEQYLRIKREHRDAILFFRLGDFYEMFYEDAKTASPILEIALTSRQKVPMCGVPYHAVNSYLAKLLKQGFKVAICEQVEDPKTAKGVVKRDVIKVLTPGTAVEVDLEGSKENVYLASIFFGQDGWGLALIDLAGGQIRTAQGSHEDTKFLVDDLFRSSPKEIVLAEGQDQEVERLSAKAEFGPFLKSRVEAWVFDYPQSESLLLEHFKVTSLAGFGLEGKRLAVSAAGALLHYLKKIRKDSLSFIRRISFVHAGQQMTLDATTIKNLELIRNLRDGRIKDSLLDVIDFTVTVIGGRLLKSWLLQPLVDEAGINARLDAVEEWLGRTVERRGLRENLKGVSDLERLTGKISLAAAHARDLVSLKRSLAPLPAIQSLLQDFRAGLNAETLAAWDNGEDIASLIDRSILDEPAFLLTEGGIIKDGFNTGLDDLRTTSRSGKSFIAGLEKRERERTGIHSLKVRYNKVFGYYIEVTKPNLHLVPPDYTRKQTLLSSERFLTPELKEYEEKVLTAEEKIAELEHGLFLEVREAVARETERLQRIAAAVARLDVLSSLAELASQRNYFRPLVDRNDRIAITEGRHPVIEKTSPEPFIPNDTHLDRDENQILIITGPNMGGKSTYLRQVALITILGQMGSFVPARSAEIGLVDRIFTRIGAMDFLNVGQSTFMVEMLETANILNNATPRSLLLLDEIGRGTSTFDGLSIAWAVAEHLHEKEDIRPMTLFATHYHELTDLALTMKKIKNFHVSVKEWKEEVIFLRKIVPGPSDQSYGIQVAKLAGIPRSVIERAREVLSNLEKLELDETGLPRLAYRSRRKRDKAQLLLFAEERELERWRELKGGIEEVDISSLTPLDALNYLSDLKKKIKESGGDQ
jgi:DNA mismatch repair protein MutS